MNESEKLRAAIEQLTPLTHADWTLLLPGIGRTTIAKGDFFNRRGTICRRIGFLERGLLRAYYPVGEGEINVAFFREQQFAVSYLSFVTQQPCLLNVQALEDTELLLISHEQLHQLYQAAHAWERFGRLIAELAFMTTQKRAESFLFTSAEERYLAFVREQPELVGRVPLYHLASYLGVRGPSLSRIRQRLSRNQVGSKITDFNPG